MTTLVGADLTAAYYGTVSSVLLRIELSATGRIEQLPQLPARRARALDQLDLGMVALFPLPEFVSRKGYPPWDSRSKYDPAYVVMEVSLFAGTRIDDGLESHQRWVALDRALSTSVRAFLAAGCSALFLLGIPPADAVKRFAAYWSLICAIVPHNLWVPIRGARQSVPAGCESELRALSSRWFLENAPTVADDAATSDSYSQWLRKAIEEVRSTPGA